MLWCNSHFRIPRLNYKMMPPSAKQVLLITLFACLELSMQQCVPPYSSQRPPHTLCKPRNPYCTILASGLSVNDRSEVLQAHNDKRSMVAQGRLSRFPYAANMYQLVSNQKFQIYSERALGSPVDAGISSELICLCFP